MINLLKNLHELKLDNKKLILMALVCFMAVYIDFTLLMKLQLQPIRSVSPKIARMKKGIDNLTKDLSRLQNLERIQSIEKAKTGLKRRKEIISEDKILLLLQDISDIANKNGLKITQINTAKDPKAHEEAVAGVRLLPVIIKLDLSCRYHALVGFLSSLENAGKFIEVQEMKIARDPRNYLVENVNLILKTYARK